MSARLRAFVILWALAVGLCACEGEPIAEGLAERQASRLAALLEAHQIPVEVAPDAASSRGRERRWQVRVPSAEAPAARAILTAHGLPQAPEDPLPEASEAWPPQLFSSVQAEAERERVALSRALAQTLSELPRVLHARLHLDLSAPPPSAAVLLRTVRLSQGDADALADQTKALLVGAVRGLDPSAVQVSVNPPDPITEAVPLGKVGPWHVARGSVSSLRWVLGALTASMMGLSAALLWALRRRSSRSSDISSASPSSSSSSSSSLP